MITLCSVCLQLISMTDKSTNDTRPTGEETKEIRTRNLNLPDSNFNTNNKHARSPPRGAMWYCEKDVGTPKPRSRRRFNCCSNGGSPSEADALQDIIWDPASPPGIRKAGKEAGESVRVVEISEIVKRIAPNEEKSVDEDSVLHWIGDSAIPCTPEVQQPRVRRDSARRQCNNVEDLMKLAKQFDLTMTRQHKDTLERLQNTESLNFKDLHKLNKLATTHPESESNGPSAAEAKGLGHEEELHAMFDDLTQHLSGRLSPLSADCSQESRTVKPAAHGISPITSDSWNLLKDAQVSKPDFDDDWENDDLLSDFVLEGSQNSCMAKPTSHIWFAASKNCEPRMAASSSQACSRDDCLCAHQNTTHYNRNVSETYTNLSSFRSYGPVQSNAIMQLSKITPNSVNTDSEYQTAHTVGGRQQIFMTTVGPGAKYIASSAGASRKDPLWGDDDDDLLYQACDVLERSAAIKEKQKEASYSLTEVPSSVTISSSINRSSTTIQSEHPTEYRHSVCVFARSHSIPGASGNHGNKQGLPESAGTLQVNHYPDNSKQKYHFTQLKHATGPSGENSNHSTFKRHQSDPGMLKNKVFITSQPAVKCTALEIERKKQEAIARRRLRLQATLKPAAPT